jgi:hypothetical protein
VLVPP